jgi:23S rRNA (guanosine2251-2'-O)-methyltransferase
MQATVIIGKHAVKECLQSDAHIEKLYIRKRQKDSDDIRKLIALANKHNVQTQWLESNRFDQRFSGDHQGIACITHDFNQCTVEDIIQQSPSVVLVLDHILDPHNFGAICRTAEAFGVTHICYPKDRAVQITPSVVKASAGAIQNISLCKLTNLMNGLKKLANHGFWIYGASSNQGMSLKKASFNKPMVLICGSEDKGISPGLTKIIDEFIHIPLEGKTSSLNVSVATGIIINTITP